MTVAAYLLAILGVALLLMVHEAGHYFAARWFGLRVERVSIGFGPTLWKYEARRGGAGTRGVGMATATGTVYQIAIIPFLAYVQIAGMNPYDESDPKDRGSYANAGLWARAVTMAAGSLANYVFASVLVFVGLLLGKHGVAEAARISVVAPTLFVRENLAAVGAWIVGKGGHLAVSGPVGLVKAAATQAKLGPAVLLEFLGMVSAAMGAFNLLPFPFLDGGRLMFLAGEAVSRRKPDAKVEVWVHAAGLIVLMTFMVFATYGDVVR
jgi:membrane-associated protease RseP (regulator of RpoE activity)